MNNSDLAMHIHKCLRGIFYFRTCAEIVIQKSMKNEVTRKFVYSALILINRLCAVNKKISDIAICILREWLRIGVDDNR